jgi:two-component system, chemotaxis family, protein-glutamate methylesterase/glutaminase
VRENSSVWRVSRPATLQPDDRLVRVLVVDDSRFARRVIQMCLESSGRFAVVGQAADGREGLQLIGTLRPDVVTLDLDMPRYDGRYVLNGLGDVGETRVVLVTALPLADAKNELAGAYPIVQKAFTEHSLDFSLFEKELIEKVWSAAKAG